MLSAASLPIIAGLLPSATRAAASSSPAPSLEVAHSGRSALAQALGFSLPSHAGKVRSHAPRAALLLSAASLPVITGVLPLVLRARAAPRQVHTCHSLARPAALKPGATAAHPATPIAAPHALSAASEHSRADTFTGSTTASSSARKTRTSHSPGLACHSIRHLRQQIAHQVRMSAGRHCTASNCHIAQPQRSPAQKAAAP